MKTSLQTIYPQASWHKQPATEPSYVSIPDAAGFLWVPRKDVSDKELALLTIIAAETPLIADEHHLWYQVLFQQKPVPTTGRFRVLQLQLQVTDHFLTEAWKEQLLGIFTHAADLFFLSPEQAVLVEEEAKQSLNREEIEGLLFALDDDFETVSRAFLGHFHHSSENFSLLFQEEQAVFQTALEKNKQNRVFTLSEVALSYFTNEALTTSNLVHSIKNACAIDEELKKIIQALWRNQGNLSSTAKELFMHRNTLQYRLEKFHETTGLQLKKMDDLVFCYLLLKV